MLNIYFLRQHLKFINSISKAIMLFGIATLQTVCANPEGGVVSSGQAVINSERYHVEITQQSNKAVIDWRNFNIEANEQTKFTQPSKDSVVLNRIHSNTASEIKGQLTANGKLILINQNGILFDKTAIVDVNGLIATTANISNDKFMQDMVDNDFINNPKLVFDQKGAKDSKIINDGQIIAKDGLVGLIAPHVINSGLIVAKAAKVHLASGETFALDLYGDSLINVAISEDLENQLILNSGNIIADGNQIALTAAAGKLLINSLIANSGALQARSVAQQNGEVIIFAEGSNAIINNRSDLKGIKLGESKVMLSGSIDVSGLQPGESGGKIQILGDNIGLIENAVINASGHSGKYNTALGLDASAKRIGATGGEILVGGDYLGKGKVPAARILTVEPGVTIYSDSKEIGDAGRIVFWSDGVNKFNGQVYARSLGGEGSRNYGNGGFVETSGKQLIVNGYVDLAAANGAIGTYLLDPSTVAILSNSATPSADAGQELYYVPGSSGTTELNANYLQNQNADLSLLADNVILDLNGDTINLTNNHKITVEARDSMVVNSAGNIFTDGGNIIIKLDQNNLDLTSLSLKAENAGAIKLHVVNGTLTLGDILGANYLEAIAYNYLLGDVVILPNKQFNAETINITAFRDLILDLQNSTLNMNSSSIYTEAKRSIKVDSAGTWGLNTTLNNNTIDGQILSKNAMDFTNLSITAPDFSTVNSTLSFSTVNGPITLGNVKAQMIDVNASGPVGNMVWINGDKQLNTEAILVVLDNSMVIDFQNNNNAAINISNLDCNCDKVNLINIPSNGTTINSGHSINFDVTQGVLDLTNVGLIVTDPAGTINLINHNGSIIIGNCRADQSIKIHTLGAAGSDVIFSPNAQLNSAYNEIYTSHYATNIIFDLQGSTINLPENSMLNVYSQKGGSINTISRGIIETSGSTSINIYSNRYNTESNIDLGNLNIQSNSSNLAITNIINNYGSVTLGNINTGFLLVQALGNNLSNIVISAGKQLSPNAIGKSLILVAEGNLINQNEAGFNAFNLVPDANWVAYFSGASAANQGIGEGYLGNYVSKYSFNYDPNNIPSESNNLLIFAPSLNAHYEDRNVVSLNPRLKKGITISATNLQLVGIDAANYSLEFVAVDVNNNPVITGNIGKIDPRPVTAILNDNNKVTKLYDGTVKATLASSNYDPLNNVVDGDDLYLTNYTQGYYSHPQVDPNGSYQGVTASYLKLSGADFKNYTLAFDHAYKGNIGYIYTAGLTVYLTGISEKVYDGNLTARLTFNPSGINSNYLFAGVAERDVGMIDLNNYEIGWYDNKNVGRNKLVSVSGLTLSGRAADNYYLDPATVISGNIGVVNKKIVNPLFKEEAQVTKIYDGNTRAEAGDNDYKFQGLVEGDSLILRN